MLCGVSDLPAWTTFARDMIGFQVVPGPGDTLALRMDEYTARILLTRDAADDLLELGWEFDSESELKSYVEGLRANGIRVEDGTSEARALRRVEQLYCCTDLNGLRHAFYCGPAISAITDPFRSQQLIGPGFVTGPLGVGHVLLTSSDYHGTVNFCRSVLGLHVTDYIRDLFPDGKPVEATFFHTRTGRHHSVAVASRAGPRRVSHAMVQYQSMDDVGLAYDRCIAAGVPMTMHLGHHPNDHMFSFYARTPSGFSLECGCGGIVVNDDDWKVVSYSKLSDWGHKRTPVA
jgi:2,3-dihydroxybiphenyl 1,2-dioxygenase